MIVASFGCLGKVRIEMNRMSTSYLVARRLLMLVRHDVSRDRDRDE